MSRLASGNGLDAAARFFWAATLVTLPVTSFRYFPAGDGTYVRPLSLFPLLPLVAILALRLVQRKTLFPKVGALTPMVGFLLVAAAVSALGILLNPLPLHGQAVLGRIARAWVTVGVGVLFFLAACWMNRNENELRFSIRWLLVGLVADILWSGLQSATFYLHLLPKPLVTNWQRLFSLRELIRTNRISGLAYEPSWLAGQLSTLYMPWLVAAVLTRQRLTRFRWLEPILLLVTAALLLATFSRGGLLTVLLAAAVTVVVVGREPLRSAWVWFLSGFRRGKAWYWRLGVLAAICATLVGALVFLGQKGYIARLWNTQAGSVAEFLVQNSAGARAAYISGAMAAYEEHPWTGVGLGASGFYIYGSLPDWALTTVPEIARQLSPESTLYPNPKNLYVRLLAETGLIGFFLFLAFQFSLLGDALEALKAQADAWQYLGAAALFTWVALVVYNMTQDSLATPNLWINLGMLAGMAPRLLKARRHAVPRQRKRA